MPAQQPKFSQIMNYKDTIAGLDFDGILWVRQGNTDESHYWWTKLDDANL